ncbi:right-handed parallel beta-helix repeat-containing protein [Halorussus lipolyticus]|uniref:right-handed parallel beta-helix repeat-containing protein n=1 Tax=Halorussus lipolyticus TaxID=3034024 RepID=UPI0023E7D574|nr:right-handed parallel beta-helix repeat-containing protein [Halorussus sp. DT80]
MLDRPTAKLVESVALLVVLGTVGVVAVPAGTALGAQGNSPGPTEIDRCTAITDSGEYVLAGDVANGSPTNPRTGLGACIAVRADDVTLRGGNHTVAAGPTGAPGVVGVLVENRAVNVTVANLTTTRWGAGVAVVGASRAALRNVSAVNNLGDGFFVENAPGVEIRGGAVRGSNTGIFLRNSPDARVAGVTVTDNLAGVSVRRSEDATVSEIEAAENSQFGLAVSSSANATVADSSFAGNGFAEVALARADGAHLRNLTIAGETPGWALYVANDSTAVGEEVGIGATRLSFEARDVALDSATGTPPLPLTERQVVGDPIVATPTGESAGLSLTVNYADAAVERASTTEDTLSLWRFDAGDGWNSVATTVDAERNRASARFENLRRNGTVIALVGEGLAEAENETDAE